MLNRRKTVILLFVLILIAAVLLVVIPRHTEFERIRQTTGVEIRASQDQAATHVVATFTAEASF